MELDCALPKKAIFDKFKPNTAGRERFDADIRRLVIVNEVSPATAAIAASETVEAFYVVLVILRGAECGGKNLTLLATLVDQNMLFVLEHEGKARLATVRNGRVIQEVLNHVGLIYFSDNQANVYSVRIADMLVRSAVEIESLINEMHTNAFSEEEGTIGCKLIKLNNAWRLEDKVIHQNKETVSLGKKRYLDNVNYGSDIFSVCTSIKKTLLANMQFEAILNKNQIIYPSIEKEDK
jgi:hypothetical protein